MKEVKVRTTLVVPTYWTFEPDRFSSKQKPIAVYDHPTFISESGTLPRLIRSLEKMRARGVDVPKTVVLIAVTHKELEKKAEEKIESVLEEHSRKLEIIPFSFTDLKFLVSHLKKDFSEFAVLLSLTGYSNIRNLGLVISQILGSEAVIFLDDDEVVTDKSFLQKCTEFVGEEYEGKIIGGVTGYYVAPSGSYWLKDNAGEWWKTGWRKRRKMNEVFKIIEDNTRLKDTPFAFGGNMVLYKELFEKVPFDPYIPRGEDMDMLVNAKMFDFAFLLDNHLRVVHSPEYSGSRWSEMRQDIYRFAYMRKKLQYLKHGKAATPLQIESLEPYPGYFLRRDMIFKFVVSSLLSAIHSTLKNSTTEFMEYLMNVKLSLSEVHPYVEKHYKDYFDFQKIWAKSMPLIRGNKVIKDYLQRKKVS
jgi:glycosyltransferase involved in cell wall biosynthesis